MKRLRPILDWFRRELGRRFYNRLFFLNAAIFIVVVYALGAVTAALTAKLDISNHNQSNLETLAAICDEYDRKHDNFYNIILPLYESTDNKKMLSGIITRDYSIDLDNALFKQRIVNMLHELSAQDKDIEAVLLHRNNDGEDYLYVEYERSFIQAPAEFPYLSRLKAKSPYGRAVYGVEGWNRYRRQCHTYGIAGSLGSGSNFNNAGVIMIAYDVNGLHRVYQKYRFSGSGNYYIVSTDGEVIFDSTRQLYGKPFPHMELLDTPDGVVGIDGAKSIMWKIDHANRHYYGLYIEEDSAVSLRIARNWFLIIGACTGISLLSALLYLMAGLLSGRRVRELEHAMGNIGANNLDYRVPVRGHGDEFEQISVHFNHMCDRLQDNINKQYVNEIKQKKAELSALQSGINPHFLYNTLEAIRNKAAEDGNEDVAEFIVLLASLLRSLVRSQMFITVHQEIDFCRMYLDIFLLRYPDRVSYTMDIDPDVLRYGVPKGLLQPVLENYFMHGIREDAYDNHVAIIGRMAGENIVVVVEDNGKGLDAARLNEIQSRLDSMDTSHTTFGLPNVHERIRLVFGKDCGLTLQSQENVKTRVTVRVQALTCEDLAARMTVTETGS